VEEFGKLLEADDDAIDVLRAALWIAQHRTATLDVELCVRQVDAMVPHAIMARLRSRRSRQRGGQGFVALVAAHRVLTRRNGSTRQAKELEAYLPPAEERYPLRVIGAINKFLFGAWPVVELAG
jgi:hypothetical protein